MYLHSMPVKMAASSSKAVSKWHRFDRFPLPNVHNSHTRKVRQRRLVMRLWKSQKLTDGTKKPGFSKSHIFLVIIWRNNRIVTSSLLPKLAFFRTVYIFFIIKFPYNAHSDWLKQRALSENRERVDDGKLAFKCLLRNFDKFDPN